MTARAIAFPESTGELSGEPQDCVIDSAGLSSCNRAVVFGLNELPEGSLMVMEDRRVVSFSIVCGANIER